MSLPSPGSRGDDTLSGEFGAKVLVIDDDASLLRALTISLTARGYEVVGARSGEEGLDRAAHRHPDVVLLDLGLPGIDGVEVIRGIRGWSSVPIIVLSARHQSVSKVQALDLGADDYLTKPFGVQELGARIQALLRRSQGLQGGRADVGAEGVAKEDGAPFTLQEPLVDAAAALVGQLERAADGDRPARRSRRDRPPSQE